MNSSPLAKYAPALIQIAIVLVGAFAQITGRITITDALQLIPLVANAFLVYLVPLFGAAMRSGWKTGVAVIGALATSAVPLVATGHITGAQIAIVLLAGLQVLGAHIGVQIRNDAGPALGTVPAVFVGEKAAVGEPPTDTTMTRAITSTGGEFIGDAAR